MKMDKRESENKSDYLSIVIDFVRSLKATPQSNISQPQSMLKEVPIVRDLGYVLHGYPSYEFKGLKYMADRLLYYKQELDHLKDQIATAQDGKRNVISCTVVKDTISI